MTILKILGIGIAVVLALGILALAVLGGAVFFSCRAKVKEEVAMWEKNN